ncbi:MAG: DUF3857 domain-containing protein [Chitinophagaceae bacterium]|nr:DUF3857 domain-containing protein [Chitinophagaceae bacterium]
MKRMPYPLLVFFIINLSLTLQAQSRKPLIQKTPAWVTIRDYNSSAFAFEQEIEDGYADIAFDNQISVADKTIFSRTVLKIITEGGIQNASKVSVSFDPSYQTVYFHTIRIIRGDEIIDQLNLSKMKIIQQEEELDRFLYNGSLKSVLFLEDVRKGDVIDYSYSITGSNPVFKGKFSTRLQTAYSFPVGNIYYKVICPVQKHLIVKNRNTGVEPLVKDTAGNRVYEWKLTDVKSLRLDDNVPLWFDPYGEVMVSEYKDWAEINEWAMALFPPVEKISPALQQKITNIRENAASDEQKVLNVLRFVQDDIRYMGIEMGQNSHKPHHPNQVFAQRFGDCKDKTYLMCTMLNAMNIEADPVLINSYYKQAIHELLPSSRSFDHVTVRVSLHGKSYFFDPTISLQRGNINTISYPDYQYELVVAAGTTGLTKIETKEPGVTNVKEVFDIRNMAGNAGLVVTTDYSGSFADDIRNQFSTTSRYEMQKTYRDFYAGYYKDIVADSLLYYDNDTTGIFTTVEYYSIKNIWDKNGKEKSAFFTPFVIDGIIKKPKEIARTMPYRLSFPAKYKESVIINMPDEWNAEENNEKISTGYFVLNARHSYHQKRFLLEYEYESLRDHVEPAEMEDFSKQMQKREDRFGYALSDSGTGDSIVRAPAINKSADGLTYLYTILVVLAVIGITTWIIRKNNM